MYLPDKLEGFVTTDNKPDPRSIDGLISWLETKPADDVYDYYSLSDCLFAQYGRYAGVVKENGVVAVAQVWGAIPWASTAHGPVAAAGNHTFGGALARAMAYMAYKARHGL